MKNLLVSLIMVCCSISFTPVYSQSVSLSKQVYAPGEKITVYFSGFAGTAKDWISMAQPGSTDDKYLYWVYTNGATSGSVELNGTTYGNYEIRGYFNNEFIVRARTSVKVGNADGNTGARTTQASYKPYEKISVSFTGMPGNAKDWVSVATVGSADDKYIT